jgi:hypothetical protein
MGQCDPDRFNLLVRNFNGWSDMDEKKETSLHQNHEEQKPHEPECWIFNKVRK